MPSMKIIHSTSVVKIKISYFCTTDYFLQILLMYFTPSYAFLSFQIKKKVHATHVLK